MANTYTWKVGQCDRVLETGVITTLHYTVSAVTEDGVYSAGAYGSINLEAPDSETMVPYDDVTESQAISWAQGALGGEDKVSEIHAALDAQLTEKRTPTTGTGTPW
tara:strand:- start:65 stop:382 length:318 start_codon:yes stop_codon:yes gene_type:complete